MRKSLFAVLSALGILLIFAGFSTASPDYYVGDSAIYGGPAGVSPNVLFVIDNSAGMRQSGVAEPYDPDVDYSAYGDNTKNAIYVRQAATKGTINYNKYIDSASSLSCADAKNSLVGSEGYQATGAYYGPLKKDGSCNASQSGNYYLGNFLNYLQKPAEEVPSWQANHEYKVGDKVKDSSTGTYVYVCTQAGTSGASNPAWPTGSGDTVVDNTVIWMINPDSIIDMVETTVSQVVESAKDAVSVGIMVFGENNHGAAVLQPVQDISASTKNVIDSLNGISDGLLPSNLQPVNEALWDAGLYYRGKNSSVQKISSDKVDYPSPAAYDCQKNFIVVITTGNSPDTVHTKNLLTDLNQNGTIGDAADASIYNLNDDVSVQTLVIQLMSAEVPILKEAANKGNKQENGGYYNVWDTTGLTEALHDAIANILLEVDTSFVAPVVPASPENRTYSGQRIYLGFFKPMNDEPWYGNLKKFGLNYDNQIVAFDDSGDLVPATDADGYFFDTNSGKPESERVKYPTPLHFSFWNLTDDPDGGLVDAGGVGGLLKSRNTARKIYSYLGTNVLLSHASNAFAPDDPSSSYVSPITAAMLGVLNDVAKNELINFIHGYEADGTTKRTWVLGDILHSKPLIVNYASYSFSETNETDKDKNHSMIFFGANDGMLHAIYDYNGEEAWAFIPPELLDDLRYLKDSNNHYYFVDNSPLSYVYDANGNGTVETGDRVILIFGLRRGGGSNTLVASSRGSYYALDVTDRENPKYLWHINSETSGFGEMGETWSQPRLAKMKIGSEIKVVAVFGAGYDNIEDLRFGNTQSFPPGTNASTNVSAASDGFKVGASIDGAALTDLRRGRGLYVVEVATLDASNEYIPDFSHSGELLWSATYNDSTLSDMTYSIPSDVLVFDKELDGYADRFYVADTGGQLWRFNVGDADKTKWTVKRIFQANIGSADVGRKVFYKPTITYKYPDTFIYFGSGDREHPLNYLNPGTADGAVLDRFYMVRDREDDDNPNPPSVITESNLVDVTENELQRDDTTVAEADALIDKLYNYDPLNVDKSSRTVYYGWYIKLDANDGEKVLAPPTVFADVAFFTTYNPNSASMVSADPCTRDNLGTSRLYAVNPRTGEAIYNWYTDSGSDGFGENQSSATSGRAKSGDADNPNILRRADRSLDIGQGIPSGLVVVIGKDGSTSILVGSGGAFPNVTLDEIETVYPLYWMTW